jgi:YHS domain-containing protein
MMTGHRRVIAAGWLGALLVAAGAGALTAGDEPASSGREIPAEFAPFEYLVGSWKGSGVPTANRVRGWNETHAWAWKFEKGAPVGLSVTATGDKVLAKGQLAFDPASKRYTLGGNDPAGKPVAFAGALDKGGKALTLDRVGTTPDGAKQRLLLAPNANFVRYTIRVLEQEPGAPQYKPVIEVGLTKEGESFAAGGSAADLPKCIVTGGAATMTVSYQGKSFPLCCTGCRDEFNENPEKYLKKLAARAGSGAGKVASSPINKDDGAFDGLVDEPRKSSPAAAKAASPGSEVPKPAPDAEAGKAQPPDPAARAAALLRIGQNLEKTKKSSAALTYYRQVVKTYPDTPAAKTAAERIKALTPR